MFFLTNVLQSPSSLFFPLTVRYDAKGEPKLTNYLQDSEYQLMKTQHCKHKVSQYPVFDSADVSRPDKNLILCALELNSKAIKTPGEKTKICYVSFMTHVIYY